MKMKQQTDRRDFALVVHHIRNGEELHLIGFVGKLSVLTWCPSQTTFLTREAVWRCEECIFSTLLDWSQDFIETNQIGSETTSMNPPQRQNYLRCRPTYKHNEILRRHLGFSLSSGFSLFPTHPLSLINYDIKWWLRNSVSKLRSKRAKRKEHENTCEHYWLCS